MFVFGSIRETVPSPLFATHAAPAPTAIADGPLPTGIAVEASDAGLMRHTVPSPAFAVQIDPSPYAIALGRDPTLRVATGPVSNVAGLKRQYVESSPFATQTASSAYVIPLGPPPAYPRSATRPLSGSIRTSVEFPKTAQMEPPPSATEPLPDDEGRVTAVGSPAWLYCGSTRTTEPIPALRHPRGRLVRGQPRRRSIVQWDVRDLVALARVEAGQRPVIQVPDKRLPERRRSAPA